MNEQLVNPTKRETFLEMRALSDILMLTQYHFLCIGLMASNRNTYMRIFSVFSYGKWKRSQRKKKCNCEDFRRTRYQIRAGHSRCVKQYLIVQIDFMYNSSDYFLEQA